MSDVEFSQELISTETKVARVKRHFRENKKVYIAGGIGLAIGAAAAALLGKKEMNALAIQSGVMYKPEQTIDIHIEALGDPGNIIQDLDTGIVYASQNQAARELGVYPARISEHLVGKIEHVNGHHLKFLGKAHVSEVA